MEPSPSSSGSVRLTRSRCDKVIFGVCGGVARAIGVDPIVLRVGVVVLAVIGIPYVLPAYLLAGIFMRKAPRSWGESLDVPTRRSRAALGWVLLALGAVVVLNELSHVLHTGLIAAVVAIVIGINLVLRHRD